MDLNTINNQANTKLDVASPDYSKNEPKDTKSLQNLSSEKDQINTTQIDKSVKELNKKLSDSGKQLSYSFHKETNTIVVKIKDNVTGEVLKEYPNEKNLDFISRLMEKTGLVFDQKQ